MKYPIDISVFTPSQAVGRISGDLELASLPRTGELIAFGGGTRGALMPALPQFPWQLSVTHVLHPANGGTTMLMLEDLNVATEADARAAMAYLVQAFELFADYWDRDEESTAG